MTRFKTQRRLRQAVPHLGFALWSFVFLYPILTTPVVADDYAGPFYQFADGGTGFWSSLRYGIDAAIGGVNFRLLGMPTGSFVHHVYVWLAGEFGVPIAFSYALTKYVVLLMCCYLTGNLCRSVIRLAGVDCSMWPVTYATSLIFLGTLQIHGLWSNDPVASYPLSGFGSVIFILSLFCIALRFLETPHKFRHTWYLTLLSTASVFYYEITVAAIVSVSVIAWLSYVRGLHEWRQKRLLLRWSVLHVLPFVVSGLVVIASQSLLVQSSQNYGGTTLRVDFNAIRTFGRLMIGALPGSAWGVSLDFTGGNFRVILWALPVFVVLLATAATHLKSSGVNRNQVGKDVIGMCVVSFALILCWILATLLQSVTEKVQNETPRVGFVYTHYSVGATVVAVLTTVGLFLLWGRPTLFGVKSATAISVVALLFVQWNVNWGLTDQMNQSFSPNRILLSSFSNRASVPERCKALNDWSSGPWPDYYETGMIEGLQRAYLKYHGEWFCPSFFRPNP